MVENRTVTRGAHIVSLDDAMEKGNTYLDAGANMVFADGPTTVGEGQHICSGVNGTIFYNMTAVSPRFTLNQMQDIGFAVCISILILVY